LSITIAADNLPPRLKPEIPTRLETGKRTPAPYVLNLIMCAVWVFFGLYSTSILSMARHINKGVLPAWLDVPMPYPLSMVTVLTIIFIIVDALICLGFVLATVFGGTFPPTRRFPLPDTVGGGDQPIRGAFGLELGIDRSDASRRGPEL
jgi:hypothetical protein